MLQPLATPNQGIQPNAAFVQPREEVAEPVQGGVRTFTAQGVSQNDQTNDVNRDDEQGQEQRNAGKREAAPFGNSDAQAAGRGFNLDISV